MNKFSAVIVGALVASAVALPGALADTPTHDPFTSRVGIYVDSYHNDTNATIACSGGSLKGVNGDGTLFLENRLPQTVICFVTIKKPRTS